MTTEPMDETRSSRAEQEATAMALAAQKAALEARYARVEQRANRVINWLFGTLAALWLTGLLVAVLAWLL